MLLLLVQELHFENYYPLVTGGSLGPLPIWATMWAIIYSTGCKRIKWIIRIILNRLKVNWYMKRKEKRDST